MHHVSVGLEWSCGVVEIIRTPPRHFGVMWWCITHFPRRVFSERFRTDIGSTTKRSPNRFNVPDTNRSHRFGPRLEPHEGSSPRSPCRHPRQHALSTWIWLKPPYHPRTEIEHLSRTTQRASSRTQVRHFVGVLS